MAGKESSSDAQTKWGFTLIDVVDAMSYWPEKETAVGVRMNSDDGFEYISAFGLDLLFNLTISHNPARELSVFQQRVSRKQWESKWPKLKITLQESNLPDSHYVPAGNCGVMCPWSKA